MGEGGWKPRRAVRGFMDFPEDGRTDLDFHHSILEYLDWRMAQGRPYRRARQTPEFRAYAEAKNILITAFYALPPRPVHVVGSIDVNSLPACLEEWPDAVREAYLRQNKLARSLSTVRLEPAAERKTA